MSTLPSFPFTEVKQVTRWSNFHGTVDHVPVPVYATPDVPGLLGASVPPRLRRNGDALRAIVGHCLDADPPRTLATIGGRWSLSSILTPREVALDTANLDHIEVVDPASLQPDYQNRRYRAGLTPVLVQGGARISSINRRLASARLALQTSPASNGQRIAGCLATGTHGAAVHTGAVHDGVLGIHLIVGRDRSFFLQPAASALTNDFAAHLEAQTGIPTEPRSDDDLFGAAQVALGSLGVVHAVVLETAPLYTLQTQVLASKWPDQRLADALATVDPAPPRPGPLRAPAPLRGGLQPVRRP